MLGLLLELILTVFVEGLFEGSSQKLSKTHWWPTAVSRFLAAIICFALGAIAGLLLTIFFPYRFFRSSRFPGLSLVLIPLLAALTMVGIGWLRRRQGKPLVRLDRFVYAFLFAFGMTLARFLSVL
ncbi:MAG TPA: hypothetical protein VFX97_11870 [Pyrinomonadaceae bacterium]|nr:hypothetical protein [Pyrinomonadaceae bacterium]